MLVVERRGGLGMEAGAHDDEARAALEAPLARSVSVGDLRKRAAALGAAKSEIDAALDDDDRKQALLLLIAAKGGGSAVGGGVPPTAAAAALPPSTTTVVTFAKGADGFGFRMSKQGAITGYTAADSTAALAGMPIGCTVVQVDGVDVSSIKEIKPLLTAAGERATVFTIRLPVVASNSGAPPEAVTPESSGRASFGRASRSDSDVEAAVVALQAVARGKLVRTPPEIPAESSDDEGAAAGAPSDAPPSPMLSESRSSTPSMPDSSDDEDTPTPRGAGTPRRTRALSGRLKGAAVPHPEPAEAAASVADDGTFKSCLDRPYIQKEIAWALQYAKKIIVVVEKDERRVGFFDFSAAWGKYRGTDLEHILNIDAIPYQRDEDYTAVMVQKIITKAGSERGVAVSDSALNHPGLWDFFLSHAQATGGDQAQTTSLRLHAAGKTTWYDNAMQDRSTAAMEEGVQGCGCLVLFLTGETATATVSPSLERTASFNAKIQSLKDLDEIAQQEAGVDVRSLSADELDELLKERDVGVLQRKSIKEEAEAVRRQDSIQGTVAPEGSEEEVEESEPKPKPEPEPNSELEPEPWNLIVGGFNLYSSGSAPAPEPEPEPEPELEPEPEPAVPNDVFVTTWASAGPGVTVTGNTAVQTASRTSVWSKDTLPEEGIYYAAVTFTKPDAQAGVSLGGDHFVGVVSNTNTDRKDLYQKNGAWGLVDLANDGCWADGQRAAPLKTEQCNEHGRAYGSDDEIGLLINMDSTPHTIHFYRNNHVLEGQSLSGFPDGVYIGATPENEGVSVTLSFPEERPEGWREVALAAQTAVEKVRHEAEAAEAATKAASDAVQRSAADGALREEQAAQARSAGRFVTEWSQTLRGEAIGVESSLVAVQNRPPHTGFATSVWGEETLPETGLHYWEVCFSVSGLKPGASLGGSCFVGLVNHELTAVGNIGQLDGACGVFDKPVDSLRIDGVANGTIPDNLQNSAGRCYGNGDRVGLLADMDCVPRRLYVFRNDQQLTGCVLSGFPLGVRIVACPYKPNTKATLSFPDPPFFDKEDGSDMSSPKARMRSSWADAGGSAGDAVQIVHAVSRLDPGETPAAPDLGVVAEDQPAPEPEVEAEEVEPPEAELPVDRDGWLEFKRATEKGMVWKSRDVKVIRVWGEITGTNLSVFNTEEKDDRERLAVLNLSDVSRVSDSREESSRTTLGKDKVKELAFTLSFSRDGEAPPTKLQSTAEPLWDFTFKVDMEMSLTKWIQALAEAQRPVALWKAGIANFLDSSEGMFHANLTPRDEPSRPIVASESLDSISQRAATEAGSLGSTGSSDGLAVSFSPESSSILAPAESPDKVDAEKLAKSARIRTQLAQELFLTERRYVKGLDMMLDEYMRPLEASANGDRKLGVTLPQIRDIFSVAENLRSVHQMMLLDVMEQKLGSSGSVDLSVITLGDIFSDATLQMLKMHTDYANNYQKALDTLAFCAKSKKFTAFCQAKMLEVMERGQNLQPLESYLITPIQRIMRYGMLLKELCKHTPVNHPDKELLDVALEAVEALAMHVNESKRSSELRQKVQGARDQFVDESASSWPESLQLVGPSRQYLDEGELWDVDMREQVAANGLRRCKFFVFNDMLLKGESPGRGDDVPLEYRGAMLLSSATIMRREVLQSPFLTPRGLLRAGSLRRQGVTPWTSPSADLHIIHVQSVKQDSIFDAQREALSEFYVSTIKKSDGDGLRMSRKSKAGNDEEAKKEAFVNEQMTAPATALSMTGMGESVGGTGAFLEFGALREHQWATLCDQLYEKYGERPVLEIGGGHGASWCAAKWMLVCVSKEECDQWFETLKKAVLWSNRIVEEHRKAGVTRERLRNTQSMRSLSMGSGGSGGGGGMSFSPSPTSPSPLRDRA